MKTPSGDKSIVVGKNRPFWIRGGIPIESANGKHYETRNQMTLWRCGASDNMPSMHKEK